MKKVLHLAVWFTFLIYGNNVFAYDFMAVAPSGQVLYYSYLGGSAVKLVAPCSGCYDKWSGYTKPSGNLVIPDSVTYNGDTRRVMSLDNSVFQNCDELTSVVIPNSVTTIGNSAFYGCSSITSLVFPDTIFTINYSTFEGCSSLTGFVIPNSVTFIGGDAFDGCTGLDSIYIPSSVTFFGGGAFSGCTGLISLDIECNCSIPSGAFEGCNNLSTVIIGDAVTGIGVRAFYGCYNLDTVILLPHTPPTLVQPSAAYNYVGSFYPYPSTFIIPCGSYNEYSTANVWSTLSNSLYELFVDFDVNIQSGDEGLGEVSIITTGNHNVDCDSTTIIQASAYYGYHFDHWNNGNTANPDTLSLIGDTSIVAIFSINHYTITGNSSDIVKGTVTGSATVNYLDTVTLMATANYGYHFIGWNDNNTTNPRIIVATSDITKTALFANNQYHITLYTDTSIHGSCTGSGNFNYMSQRTISATANYGYHFTMWSDGNTDNPRTITLTQDTSFTALFANNQYTIDGVSADSAQGSVTGGATVLYLDSVILTATAEQGYHFVCWSDSTTVNPKIIQVTQNLTYIAYFAPNQYTLIVQSDNDTKGHVTGGGSFDYLTECTIEATANYGYYFTMWNDGDTNNPRTITLTQDTSFTAFFAPYQYTLTVTAMEHGTASGTGNYDYGDTVIIQAFPDEHYHFTQWNDNNTDNPRECRIEEDKTYTAFFAIDTHSVHVTSNDIVRGMVEASGTQFVYGTPCTVTATAYTGYTFVGWSNGVTANPYTFAVISDVELMALFVEEGEEVYTVTVESANPTMGSVSGGGQALYGGTLTIRAIPNEGYQFLNWQDGNTENPRTVTVTENITYTAYFESTQGIEDIDATEIKIYTTGGRIVVQGAEGVEARVYDLTGREVVRPNQNGETPVLPSGVYLVKVGTLPARKVVVMR